MKKRIISLIIMTIMLFLTSSCGKQDYSNKKNPASDDKQTSKIKGGFKVNGTKLLDAKGNEFVFRGVNHAHTWFKDKTDTALEAIAKTGSNSVRIVLSDGFQWTKDDAESVRKIVDKCKELEMIAILEVHDATGNNSTEPLESACNYWIEIKDVLIGNEAYVILNISNEWTGNWNSKLWRDGYVNVIPKIREAGIKNTILVDAGGWGQYGQCIADYGLEVFNCDVLKNTMFSVHMYGTAGKNQDTIKKNLEGATNQNLCVCVGEFGYTHTDGDVDEEFILEYCQKNSIGYLAWSWKGNGGGVEYLDMALEWDGSWLSQEWGEVVVNGKNGIKETSKKCSVFE